MKRPQVDHCIETPAAEAVELANPAITYYTADGNLDRSILHTLARKAAEVDR